jgi:hypothetical protein
MWVLGGLLICVAVVVAGRRHSRYLDKLDEIDRKGFEPAE